MADTNFFVPTVETQETTMQVPYGESSFLSALFTKTIAPLEAITLLYANYRSNYDSGQTHFLASRGIAKVLGVSKSYIKKRLRGMRQWLSTQNSSNSGSVYRLVHHLCADEDVPTDMLGDPLKFAVPRGKGGPIERMEAGDITWRACLVWILLKFLSDWKTGETFKMSMTTLSDFAGMNKQQVCDAIRELREAGMLMRLSKPWEVSRFQLYPKPPEKTESARMAEKHERKKRRGSMKIGGYDVTVTGAYAYSGNKQWRIRFEDGRFEKKKSRKWVLMTEMHNIPESIKTDLNQALETRALTQSLWGGANSDPPGTHSDPPGTSSDPPLPFEGWKPAWERGSEND